MRFAVLALLVLGCGSKSKLDTGRTAEVDALWDLAPDGTELGIVASPRAVGLGFRAIAALEELVKQPDLAPLEGQLYAITKSMFGSETATPEDAGYSSDKGLAMFATADGVIGVMPVGNRDKFMAAKKGTRGSAEDTLDGNTCRQIGQHYMCATKKEMFDRIGKGKAQHAQGPKATRGDAELYVSHMKLLGEQAGALMLAAQLEPGQVSLTGHWIGAPDGPLATYVGAEMPKPDTKGASGFVALNVKPLLADAPALPIAGDVTLDQLAKSLAGPVTAVIPAGTVDLQFFIPLLDPKPAQTVIEHCDDVGKFFTLAQTQTPGACRIVLQGTNALELDAWVEGSTLRLGGKKGPAPAGKPTGMTAFGRELGDGSWTAAFWGRGTMLNLSGIAPATQEVPREVALGIHAMGLVNELGVAARVEKDGLRFRAVLRTAWANPPKLTDDLVKIEGNDILTGKANEPARKLAASAPGSPFATDYDAGQGGLMVPAAMIGLASAVVIPMVMRMFGGGGEEQVPPGEIPAETPQEQTPL